MIEAHDLKFASQNVLVVDNIVDTGNTFRRLCTLLGEFEPKTVKTCRYKE